eukprot:TRINITY_DN516_c0_g1_i5.p1 TRINITY_DN516_c0_g1~~TRINITY_DN516_c0_g1_i5.p1  ORF type:complete len:1114 (+),score=518.85 TRINITY_DN516_c0_g1_i5:116-3343(+)
MCVWVCMYVCLGVYVCVSGCVWCGCAWSQLAFAVAPHELDLASVASVASEAEEPTVLEAWQRQQREAAEAAHQQAKSGCRQELGRLSEQLEALLQRNERAAELDRLPTHEIVLDHDERQRLVDDGDREVQRLRDKLVLDNACRDLVVDRLRREFYDSMRDQPALCVRSIRPPAGGSGGLAVSNYALRSRTASEQSVLAKVRLLRRVELHEVRSRWRLLSPAVRAATVAAPKFALAGSLREWHHLLSAQSHQTKRKEAAINEASAASEVGDGGDEANGAGGSDGAAEGDDEWQASAGNWEALESLLYHAFDLQPPMRKRSQMLLLEQLVYDAKREFNGELSQMLELKRLELAKIADKTANIVTILADLRRLDAAHAAQSAASVELFTPQLHESERADSVLTILDSELTATRPDAPPAGQPGPAGGAAGGPGGANSSGGARGGDYDNDDFAERALKAMMGGSLDNDKNNSRQFDEELVKPAHLNKPDKELTDDELKELREFERKVQELLEEHEKRRKFLEADMSKQQASIGETCAAFDEQLQRLQRRKLKRDEAVFERELALIKLAQALLRDEHNERREQALVESVGAARTARAAAGQQLSEARRELEAHREALETAQTDDRQLEKLFKRDLDRDAPELAAALFKLYKRRHRVPARDAVPALSDGGSSGNLLAKQHQSSAVLHAQMSEAGGSSSSVVGLLSKAQQLVELSHLEPYPEPNDVPRLMVDAGIDSADRPEACDDLLWGRLIEARQSKLDSEAELKKKTAVGHEMQRWYESAAERDASAAQHLGRLVAELRSLREQRQLDNADLDVLLKLRQGQVEVEPAAVVTDYSQASLLHQADIVQLNTVIRALGSEKVNVLKELKNTKKQIARKKWDNERLEMIGDDLVERTKYFQLLRVTKRLQELIKGGAADLHAAEINNLEQRHEYSAKAHQQKLHEKRQLMQTMRQRIDDKVAENQSLQLQLNDVDFRAQERSKIHDIQRGLAPTQTLGGSAASANSSGKMQEIVNVRKLKDIVQVQAHERDALLAEVNRYRQRTFPFAGFQANETANNSISSSSLSQRPIQNPKAFHRKSKS